MPLGQKARFPAPAGRRPLGPGEGDAVCAPAGGVGGVPSPPTPLFVRGSAPTPTLGSGWATPGELCGGDPDPPHLFQAISGFFGNTISKQTYDLFTSKKFLALTSVRTHACGCTAGRRLRGVGHGPLLACTGGQGRARESCAAADRPLPQSSRGVALGALTLRAYYHSVWPTPRGVGDWLILLAYSE